MFLSSIQETSRQIFTNLETTKNLLNSKVSEVYTHAENFRNVQKARVQQVFTVIQDFDIFSKIAAITLIAIASLASIVACVGQSWGWMGISLLFLFCTVYQASKGPESRKIIETMTNLNQALVSRIESIAMTLQTIRTSQLAQEEQGARIELGQTALIAGSTPAHREVLGRIGIGNQEVLGRLGDDRQEILREIQASSKNLGDRLLAEMFRVIGSSGSLVPAKPITLAVNTPGDGSQNPTVV